MKQHAYRVTREESGHFVLSIDKELGRVYWTLDEVLEAIDDHALRSLTNIP